MCVVFIFIINNDTFVWTSLSVPSSSQVHFGVCVDNHLLKANNLIGPQDYHLRQSQPSRAPEGNP